MVFHLTLTLLFAWSQPLPHGKKKQVKLFVRSVCLVWDTWPNESANISNGMKPVYLLQSSSLHKLQRRRGQFIRWLWVRESLVLYRGTVMHLVILKVKKSRDSSPKNLYSVINYSVTQLKIVWLSTKEIFSGMQNSKFETKKWNIIKIVLVKIFSTIFQVT